MNSQHNSVASLLYELTAGRACRRAIRHGCGVARHEENSKPRRRVWQATESRSGPSRTLSTSCSNPSSTCPISSGDIIFSRPVLVTGHCARVANFHTCTSHLTPLTGCCPRARTKSFYAAPMAVSGRKAGKPGWEAAALGERALLRHLAGVSRVRRKAAAGERKGPGSLAERCHVPRKVSGLIPGWVRAGGNG